jgi:hypothetical protein
VTRAPHGLMVGRPRPGSTVLFVDDGPQTPARTTNRDAAPRTKPPLFRHPKRVAIVGGGLFVVAALIAGAIGSADTSNLLSSERQPKAVQGFSPPQGAIVPPNTPITVDLQDDLIGDLTICGPNPTDCTPIPFDQVRFVPGLGQITFKPSENTDVTEYPTGPVTVRVDYRLQGSQGAEPGSYTWSFLSKA